MSRNGSISYDSTILDLVREHNTISRVPTQPVYRIPSECCYTYCSESVTHMIGAAAVCNTHLHQVLECSPVLRVVIR